MNTELSLPNTHSALLEFFRGLADARRLQIAGQLAAGNCTVEQLSEQLGHSPQEIRRQLFFLERAGLVAGPSSPARTYRLRLDNVHALASQVLARERTAVPPEAAADDFERKVLREFLRPDGTIREFPTGLKRMLVIVRCALKAIEPGRRYTEREINDALQRLHPDSATLRRWLVDYGYLAREKDGRAYWRTDAIGVSGH